jgi:hypothetical protein
MNQRYIFALLILLFSATLVAQKVANIPVNKVNLSLRGGPVIAGQVTLTAPGPGTVILRFDGHCLSSPGDRIILAASNTTNWGSNDGCVEVESASDDIDGNTFSHTRAYEVAAGDHTFYAVAENHTEMDGSGIASIFGHLTAEWFPEEPGKPFARHSGFYAENIPVEGGPVPFSALTINAPEAGKVLLRFDGKCVSSFGDLMYFAASNNLAWTQFEGSTSNEVIDNDLNRFSFSHARVYDVQPGNHTFYAIAENFFETYGNGFASIYGSLTAVFYPNSSSTKINNLPIGTLLGVNIEGPIATVGQTTVQAPVKGQIVVNLVGTGIGSFGDKIKIGVANVQSWEPEDGSISFEPYSVNLNRTSFSQTRVYQVDPGDHTFYALMQNVDEFEGSGLAVLYANLTTEFIPDASSSVEEPSLLQSIRLSPNPATDVIRIDFPDLATEEVQFVLFDPSGRVVINQHKAAGEVIEQLTWTTGNLPKGLYYLQVRHASGTIVRPVSRI